MDDVAGNICRALEGGGPTLGAGLDKSQAVYGELRPGEMSLHHGRTFHSAGPNRTGARRLGIAIRYIPWYGDAS